MFTVEIRIMDEASLAKRMTEMREWLDHQRFEPARFHLTYSPGIVFRVDFAIEVEAAAFAREFGGYVTA
ncbi:MAG TPA: hypothetical protein VE993_20200 [Stellaceae bacterium]|nr:hypothetical protein [Stellaceae bacterium]